MQVSVRFATFANSTKESHRAVPAPLRTSPSAVRDARKIPRRPEGRRGSYRFPVMGLRLLADAGKRLRFAARCVACGAYLSQGNEVVLAIGGRGRSAAIGWAAVGDQ
jgi:hypothetical protein